MQYSVYSERHIKGRLEAVIDRVLEVFDHHTADAVPSELCTRSEALELQDMTQGLMILLFNDRNAFLESAKQLPARINQALERLTRVFEEHYMMDTANGDAVGLPQAVHGLRTTLSRKPVSSSSASDGCAFNLVGLLSGVSWAAPSARPPPRLVCLGLALDLRSVRKRGCRRTSWCYRCRACVPRRRGTAAILVCKPGARCRCSCLRLPLLPGLLVSLLVPDH